MFIEEDPHTRPGQHPSSQFFHNILKDLGKLHDKKQRDYGTDADPFNNIRASAKEWGIPSWVGAMLRATDKVRRLQKFADKGELANESVIDAFDDLAVYAVIARVMYEEAEEDSSGPIPTLRLEEDGLGASGTVMFDIEENGEENPPPSYTRPHNSRCGGGCTGACPGSNTPCGCQCHELP